MSLIELVFVSFSLAMDAFAVALCKGLSIKEFQYKKAFVVGLYFGIFQALMPFIGYLLSENIGNQIIKISHLIVFFLLLLIGINMIIESRKTKCNIESDDLKIKSMLVLSLATSLDAFAVGISFGLLRMNIYISILIVGVLTFILSFIAVKIGNTFGNKLKNKAELLGGIILIFLAIKILI